MHLKRLEIHGFKTFASPTTLEFRPGITAIIGPNGSGKSNINDSVRWVLGEQSYAALRSKRTEDVIFGGGSKRAPSGFAEVSLTIDNTDRLLPLPYNEVTITRRANRSGENEYFINRSKVRLRDVQEAVGPLGGSYTIINQGLVDAALTLRPEERRRLFEDAAEIGIFVSRKSEAESRLRETNANVERCADVLAELEPRLRSLKRQATLARSYRELSDDLRRLLLRHYAYQWHTAKHQLAQAEAAEAALGAELAERRVAQADATAELRVARETIKVLRERLSVLHSESSQLHTRVETAQRNLAVGSERLASLAKREEEAERSRNDLSLRREELERERAVIVERLAAAEQRLGAARAELTDHEAIRARQDAERRAARQQLEQAQREEAAASAALTQAHRRAEQLAEQRTRLAAEQNSQAESLRHVEAALETQRRALAAAEEQLVAAQQARVDAAAAEERARAEIDSVRGERSKADEALGHARRLLADVEARLESLTRLQRSYAGTFSGVKAAMQWAEAERRAGFVLVSSLIRTPSKIETAVEVALGSRLQNIVVEQWQDAEEAIVALKKNGAGRATFLPLDTIRRTPDERRPVVEAGVLGIASELVDFDEHYRPVVQNLLGRTLVVEDLATARRVLRNLSGGWTIVTLAGEQVNTGGAVTGGAQIKEAGVLRRERELRELPGQVEAAKRAVDERVKARAELDSRAAAVERAVRETEAARRKAAQDYEQRREAESRTRREVERAEAAVDLQRRRHEQVAADLASMTNQERALAEEQSVLLGREQQAQARLSGLRAEDQSRLEADRHFQERLTELRAVVSTVEGELRAERALLQSQEHQLARLSQQRAEAEHRISALISERASLHDQLVELEVAHTGLMAQIDELYTRVSPAEAELNTLEQGRAELEQRESDCTAALLEGESAHGRASVEVQRARDRIDTIWERAAADDIDVEQLAHDQQLESDDGPQSGRQPEDISEQIQNMRSRLARLGAVNPLALEEYEEAAERHTFMSTQLEDLRQAANALHELIAELDATMHSRFAATFSAIAGEFEKCFVRLFGGGEAKIFMTNGGETVNGNGTHEGIDDIGIDIIVRPPGKRHQNISLLSGGERALTASALLFAILAVNPSPFCILDEVDAALDEANVGRFRAMLADLSQQTQFMLVTHNRGTIEVADTIYGVSMGEDGASRIISVRLEELIEE